MLRKNVKHCQFVLNAFLLIDVESVRKLKKKNLILLKVIKVVFTICILTFMKVKFPYSLQKFGNAETCIVSYCFVIKNYLVYCIFTL